MPAEPPNTAGSVQRGAPPTYGERHVRRCWRAGAALLLVVTAAAPTACRKQETDAQELTLPPTSVISTSEQHGIVAADSLRVRVQPSARAEVLSHFRRGEVVQVLQRGEFQERVAGNLAYWFEVNHQGVRGWVFGFHLELFAPGTDIAEVQARAHAVRAGDG